MSSAGVSCELWIGGSRFADTGEDYLSTAPTALAGLSLSWGRSTVVDQPSTATCSFSVADKDGDADFRSVLHVGRPVLLYAAGGITAGDPTDVAVNGGFESDTTNRWHATHGTAVAGTAHPNTDSSAVQFTGADASTARLSLPPDAFDNSDITAWDAIPSVSPGDTWQATVAVRPGLGQVIELQMLTFTDPASAAGTSRGHPAALPAGPPFVYADVTASWTAPDGLGVVWAGAQLQVQLASWHDAAHVSGTWDDIDGTWDDWARCYLDDFRLLAPDRAVRRVLVFSGRLTDLNTAWAGDHLEVACIAADWTADLANDVVDAPGWPAESIADRVDRIVPLAAHSFEADVDTGVGSREISRVNIDATPVLSLLTDLATSGDAVLWSAFHATRPFYLWYEDPAGRTSFTMLAMDDDSGLVEIVPRTRPVGQVNISACDIARDPVAFTQTAADILTRIDVSWLDQSVSGEPGEVHEQIVDSSAEADFGQRGTSYSTQLTSSLDANDVGGRVLNRSNDLGWRASGLVWDTAVPDEFDDTDRNRLLTLLDGTQRPGCAIVVHDLPAWAPGQPILACFLEGGTYSYEAGRWTLAMNITPGSGEGHSVHWSELDSGWAWNEFDPGIAWLDLYGVKGP